MYTIKNMSLAAFLISLVTPVAHGTGSPTPIAIGIILGSTRQGRNSDKIGAIVQKIMNAKTHVKADIIDLRDFNIPFLYEPVPPANRKEITDANIQKWSDTIKKYDAFIFVSPEYNSGYSGELKNAIDTLYVEWNNKPFGLVSYSGGPSGGLSSANQLRQVLAACKMVPVGPGVTVPSVYQAFDAQGNLVQQATITKSLNTLVDELVRTHQRLQKKKN